MNIELLQKVRDIILSKPNKFIMHHWFYFDSGSFCNSSSCGTAACIGGYAVMLHIKETQPYLEDDLYRAGHKYAHNNFAGMIPAACDALDLGHLEGLRLFGLFNWPQQYLYAYQSASSQNDYDAAAKVAAERIDFFIATNGTDDVLMIKNKPLEL